MEQRHSYPIASAQHQQQPPYSATFSHSETPHSENHEDANENWSEEFSGGDGGEDADNQDGSRKRRRRPMSVSYVLRLALRTSIVAAVKSGQVRALQTEKGMSPSSVIRSYVRRTRTRSSVTEASRTAGGARGMGNFVNTGNGRSQD